jgi:serine/threonine protein kinase
MTFASIEYADYGTLTNILNNEIIDENHLYEIFFQIFYTLAVIYNFHNIVHFDLKPDNILFVKDNNYDETKQKYYKYIYNHNVFYIRVHKFIVKIADYDASFYNNIINPFIMLNPYHMNKIRNIHHSKVDIYMVFNLLTETEHVEENINKFTGNYISELINKFRNKKHVGSHDLTLVDDIKIPPIYKLLDEKKLCDIEIFNFQYEGIDDSDIIKTFSHTYNNFYPNLKCSPQLHPKDVNHNRLKISNFHYMESFKKLNILRNNSHSLRIMTYNIHEWKDQFNKSNHDKMIYDIINVFPDILCLQENKKIILSELQWEPSMQLFHKYYELKSECNADNDLVNSIYCKRNIVDRIVNSYEYCIGDDTIVLLIFN